MKKLVMAVVLAAAGAVFAETTPPMVSLVTPVQASSSVYDVSGSGWAPVLQIMNGCF